MFVTTNQPRTHGKREVFDVVSSSWTDFKNLLPHLPRFKGGYTVVHRDAPIFKKKGYDHLEINWNSSPGKELLQFLFDNFELVQIDGLTYNLIAHQMKMDRMTVQREPLTHEDREYLRYQERLRLLRVLKEGRWLDNLELEPEQTHAVIREWQAQTRKVDLGRQSKVVDFKGVRQTGYWTKGDDVHPEIARKETATMDEEALFAFCAKEKDFQLFLEEHPASRWKVAKWKLDQGLISEEEMRVLMTGDVKLLY